jgi:hypothetical protein
MNGQLSDIFRHLRKLLKRYEPPFVAKSDYEWRYELWSVKGVVIAGKAKKEIWFASLIIQRDYVGFYYMPIYKDTKLKKVFKKELLSTLKGKSCFHIKKLDKTLLGQIRDALEIGYRMYRKNGWV